MTISADALAELRSLADRGDHMAELVIQVLDAANPSATLAARHAVAVSKPTVHQEQDTLYTGTGTEDLTHTNTLDEALARAGALHDLLVSHAADGGATAIVDAPHRAADSSNDTAALISAGKPTDLDTLIAWIGLAKAQIITHGNLAGCHFANDTGAGGTGFTLSVDPPVTKNDCCDDLNDIKTGYNTHASLASLV